MRRHTVGALLWVGAISLGAAALTAQSLWRWEVTSGDWLTLLVFGLGAALIHLLPIRSSTHGVTSQLTDALILAGALALPSSLITPLVGVALLPDIWRGRHGRDLPLRWVMNAAHLTLAAYCAHAWFRWLTTWATGDPALLGGVLGAVAIFTAVQIVLSSLTVALNTRVPIRRVDVFTAPALVGKSLLGLVGALVAMLWLVKPALLILMLPLLYLAHRLTLTAHLARLAHVDVKTGLHNSRHFEHLVTDELAHSLRVNRPMALLFADMDRFKQINDTHGHAPPAIRCCARRRGCCCPRYGPAMWWRASAARSSSPCSPAPTMRRRSTWANACDESSKGTSLSSMRARGCAARSASASPPIRTTAGMSRR